MITNRVERLSVRLTPEDEAAIAAIENALRAEKRFVTRTDVVRTALKEGLRALSDPR